MLIQALYEQNEVQIETGVNKLLANYQTDGYKRLGFGSQLLVFEHSHHKATQG